MSIISGEAFALTRLAHGYWSRPFRGTPPCGDGAGWISGEQESWLLVLDAIGHGPIAHRIARLSLDVFKTTLESKQYLEISVNNMIIRLHETLKRRNLDEQAAMNLYHFDHRHAKLTAVAVGNLEAFLISPADSTSLPSQNGMVGGRLPRSLNVQTLDLVDNSILAVFSDGMQLANPQKEVPKYVYGPYANRPLKESARLIVEGYHRDHDDASCALVRVSRI